MKLLTIHFCYQGSSKRSKQVTAANLWTSYWIYLKMLLQLYWQYFRWKNRIVSSECLNLTRNMCHFGIFTMWSSHASKNILRWRIITLASTIIFNLFNWKYRRFFAFRQALTQYFWFLTSLAKINVNFDRTDKSTSHSSCT